ncbi:hypothetical protein A1O1_02844 [Capronia coronata CBS 617.96]|uniref:Uncharacterized protein n=1 Tax=Capronia coronata CBS 617.96 TaxID=1182541 RepID=W9YPI5_9EURO|nr:uncharacterized protein A1O1_02844 [Capronia coronata CBS 617.96]EXJ94448.1 hypothetical protein A1O1_02844 [Capronia coronata CBS 617.96]
MSDKLKSKLSAIFLPRSTYTAPNMSTSGTSPPQEKPAQPGTMATPCRTPVILDDRNGRLRKQQTRESEDARDELLGHGIKVRDFQEEADAKTQDTMVRDQAQGQAQSDQPGSPDKLTETMEATHLKS